mmetsp:Transcript_1390/g.1759  ORF Transcript_1390/g.1759 Transcript_1390/m.1759 type:complete len:150 (+) Transcript_1390:582-1031(+)
MRILFLAPSSINTLVIQCCHHDPKQRPSFEELLDIFNNTCKKQIESKTFYRKLLGSGENGITTEQLTGLSVQSQDNNRGSGSTNVYGTNLSVISSQSVTSSTRSALNSTRSALNNNNNSETSKTITEEEIEMSLHEEHYKTTLTELRQT